MRESTLYRLGVDGFDRQQHPFLIMRSSSTRLSIILMFIISSSKAISFRNDFLGSALQPL